MASPVWEDDVLGLAALVPIDHVVVGSDFPGRLVT